MIDHPAQEAIGTLSKYLQSLLDAEAAIVRVAELRNALFGSAATDEEQAALKTTLDVAPGGWRIPINHPEHDSPFLASAGLLSLSLAVRGSLSPDDECVVSIQSEAALA